MQQKERVRAIICNLSLVTAFTLSGCTTEEKSQLKVFEKDGANAVNAVGKEADKAGQAIKTSVHDRENSKSEPESKSNNNVQKGASDVGNTLVKAGNTAEHAIVSTVKDVGKSIDNADKNNKGPSHKSNDFNANANHAGADLQNAVSSAGKFANQQLGKAEHAIESSRKQQESK